MKDRVRVGPGANIGEEVSHAQRGITRQQLDVEFPKHGVELRDLAADPGHGKHVPQIERERDAHGGRLRRHGPGQRRHGRLAAQRHAGAHHDRKKGS